MSNISSILYPKSRYYGEVKPENLVFNANLQEFAWLTDRLPVLRYANGG